MLKVSIAEAIVNMIEKKIFEEWKHVGYIDCFYEDEVKADIDGKKYSIKIEERGGE